MQRENEVRCPACGHAVTLTKAGEIPLHHPYGSIACEGTIKRSPLGL